MCWWRIQNISLKKFVFSGSNPCTTKSCVCPEWNHFPCREPFNFSPITSKRLIHINRFVSGFMADRFGNYTSAFLMGGGVGVIASLMPFLLLCLKQKSKKSCESEIMPLDIIECEDVAEEDLTMQQDETKLVNSCGVARKDYERSASFVMAMKSPV